MIRARIFKFSGNIYFGALISYMLKKFSLGDPLLSPGPLEGQNFKDCVFLRWTFKFSGNIGFGALILYMLKYFGLGPWFEPRPQKW